MATQFKITRGETVEVLTVKPKHILKAEREGDLKQPSAESSFRLAWYAAGSPDTFENWLEDVDDLEPIVEDDEGDENEVPPTTAGSRRSRS